MLALVKCASAQHINEYSDYSLTKFTYRRPQTFASARKTLTSNSTITYMVLWCIINHLENYQHNNSHI